MPLLAAMPMGALILDHRQSILRANQTFLDLLGYADEQTRGRAFGDLVLTTHSKALTKLLESPEASPVQMSVSFIKPGGKPLIASVAFSRLTEDARDPPRLLGIILEHGEQVARVIARDARRRLLQSAAVYASLSEGVLITDGEGWIVAVNAAFTEITGYTEADVRGRKPSLLNSRWHPQPFFSNMWRQLIRQGYWRGEIWNRRKDGEIQLQKLTIRRVLDANGVLINFVGVFAEHLAANTRPKRAEHLLHYDPLTKLPNRLLFESRLEHAIERGQRQGSPLVLFILDLDRFSHINSSLGNQIGDSLLRVVAQQLRAVIRPADTLARLHADRFGLLLEAIDRPEDAHEIARRLQSALPTTMRVSGHEVFVTLSIGIAFDAGRGSLGNAMIALAESALRLVKQRGRNGVELLTAHADDADQEHTRLIALMRGGLDKGEYLLLYRPRVNLDSGTREGVEALIRWDQPEIGMVPQERLLTLANDCGFMAELYDWALASACRQLGDWLAQGLPIASISITVPEARLTRGDLARSVAHALEENGLAAHRLELEFSESLLLKHREEMAEVLSELARLGVGLALNEVGAGWISPAVLQRLPIQTLNIHPAFIENLPDSEQDLAVVQALIAMAQALELKIRADGVRTNHQRTLLQQIGCQQALGDFYAEPLPAAQFESQLETKPAPSPPKPIEN